VIALIHQHGSILVKSFPVRVDRGILYSRYIGRLFIARLLPPPVIIFITHPADIKVLVINRGSPEIIIQFKNDIEGERYSFIGKGIPERAKDSGSGRAVIDHTVWGGIGNNVAVICADFAGSKTLRIAAAIQSFPPVTVHSENRFAC
jgi:hypothetical protein